MTGLAFYFGISLVAIITGFVFLELLIYYLDSNYIPKRKTELTNELIKVFKADIVSESVMKFKIGPIDVFAEIAVDFKRGLQIASIETITFHIPRSEKDKLSISDYDFKEDTLDGIASYNIYQTDGSGLDLAKEKLKKIVEGLPYV